MPDTSEKQSAGDMYHVMLRGIHREEIFKGDEDYLKFIMFLDEQRQTCPFQIYAYCLLPTHVHMLIGLGKGAPDETMKETGERFTQYFNERHHRTGHLFQECCKSEPIKNDNQFLNVLRYIHQCPIKANLTKLMSYYPWSSYKAYLGIEEGLVDTEKMYYMFKNKDDMLHYINYAVGEDCMDHHIRLSDEEAMQTIEQVLCCSREEFQYMSPQARRQSVRLLKKYDLSLRQISHFCGISQATASRM